MNYRTIEIEHKKMFDTTATHLYDIITDLSDCSNTLLDVLKGFEHPDTMLKSFRDGWTMVLLADRLDQIEEYNKIKMPFIVVIKKDEAIWAVINGSDCNY